jgi:hypothetical protein
MGREVVMPFHLRKGVVYRVKREFPWMGTTFRVGELWRLADVREVAEEKVYYCDVVFESALDSRVKQSWSKTQPLEPDSGVDIFEELSRDEWEREAARLRLPPAAEKTQDGPGGAALAAARDTGVCEHLVGLLVAEIGRGNRIKSVTHDVGEVGAVHVLLQRTFRKEHTAAGVRFNHVGDVHWWKAEYFCPVHRHRVACLFEE